MIECSAEDAPDTLKGALESNCMTVIVCKCRPGNIPVSVIELSPVMIRDRFMEEVKRRKTFTY